MIMKKIFLFVYLLSSFAYCYAELAITLNVETPGSLPSLIASDHRYEITDLTLTGNLNGYDIQWIRDLASNKKGALRHLDLSNTNIISSGPYYGYGFDTEENTISSNMFKDCGNLTTLILPKSVVSIKTNAFENTDLYSITLPDNLKSLDATMESFYLTEITISDTNQYFKLIDGVLYDYKLKLNDAKHSLY